MAEWVAGRGTEALSIIGTVLGGAAVANGGLGNILGGVLGGNRQNGIADTAATAAMAAAIPALVQSAANGGQLEADRKITACEIGLIRENYAKDMELAQVKAERSTDAKILDLYKWADGQIKDLRESENAKWTEQAVINATTTNGLTSLKGQVDSVTAAVNAITQTVVPQRVICNTGCNSCCGNGNM